VRACGNLSGTSAAASSQGFLTMNAFDIIAVVLTLAAVFGYINLRFIKLPTTIGLMLIALLFSLSLIAAQHLGWNMVSVARDILGRIDFNTTLMQGMLSFLLFAGALNVNLEDLLVHKWSVAVFSLFGVLCSTAIIGGLAWLIFRSIGMTASPLYCFLFGALISPTDPIAVLGLLKDLHAPKSLAVNIAGEALFNDGIGVVVFLALLELATGGHALSFSRVGFLFVTEALGGIVLGLVLGWITYHLLKSIDHYQIEVLLTLALVTGGYALANALHASGPLAIVAAGILIGNHGRHFAMSDKTREQIDTFWELIDEILNAVLFVLIGLEILVLSLGREFFPAAVMAVPLVLFARWVSVLLATSMMRSRFKTLPGTVAIMTWGGLRGGISIALALALPKGEQRELILMITYAVVVFSILVQGLTVPMLVRRVLRAIPPES
jgi:CPA1 family monovalent cation:H+ antiporter